MSAFHRIVLGAVTVAVASVGIGSVAHAANYKKDANYKTAGVVQTDANYKSANYKR